MAHIVCDTEVYQNYFLCAFKNVANGKVLTFEKTEDTTFDRDELRATMDRHTIITFNGNHFDLPIIAGAIAGYSCSAIKHLADDIIRLNLKPWITARKYDLAIPKKWDHIDLIEVAPLRASLKIYNGRLHGKRMQDLPYDPNKVLEQHEIDNTREYCINDLDATILLYNACAEPLALREEMSKKYDMDFRSKSDAQVAEALIKSQLEKLTGEKPERPTYPPGWRFKYKIPEYLRYATPQLQEIMRKLETHEFVLYGDGKVELPDFLKDEPIRIGSGEYRMGIGGLHSSEQEQAYVSDEEYVLIDRDVASYYPFIILTQKLAPEHLGNAFLKVYEDIVNTRIKAKGEAARLGKAIKQLEPGTPEYATTNKERIRYKNDADSLKIAINGSFGKLGSSYSALFAPDLMIQVTISGQLLLLLLIEWIEAAGIRIVSGNTDGIVILCPRSRQDDLLAIVKRWEAMTGLETEETVYRAIYSRDVNNYLAVKPDGSTKGKGAFTNPWFENDVRGTLQKNPAAAISLEAAIKRITHGIPVDQTIRECRDVRKFVTVRQVKGGALYDVAYLGKAVRWYYGLSSSGVIEYADNGNKVPRSEGAVPLMDLPDELPRDIDYRWYIVESLGLLEDLAFSPRVTEKNPVQTFYRKSILGMRR